MDSPSKYKLTGPLPGLRTSHFAIDTNAIQSAIMEPISSILTERDTNLSIHSDHDSTKSSRSLPDVAATSEFMSLALNCPQEWNGGSFLLLDEEEHLKIPNAVSFHQKLECSERELVKVVAIVGNTGEGKSFTMNQLFFDGKEVFRTCSSQDSCTLGVWSAFDPKLKVICLDTEGMLSTTTNENKRTRLLLKVLAIADVVIYRTRAERLHNDMFRFLSDASKSYSEHFSKELTNILEKLDIPGLSLGPAIIIFHETYHTHPLNYVNGLHPQEQLRERFRAMNLHTAAFSSLKYVGCKTSEACAVTDFSEVKLVLKKDLDDTSVRSWRQSSIVYYTLKSLNDKFVGKINPERVAHFPDQYFTCGSVCIVCGNRCKLSICHEKDDKDHLTKEMCRFSHQFSNFIYTCGYCHQHGKRSVLEKNSTSTKENSIIVLAKVAWSGYNLDCKNCGTIYQSRQYWYGNKNPLESSGVRQEFTHVWPGDPLPSEDSQNAAQKVLDGVSYFSESVAAVSAGPSKIVSSWVADRIAPSYWKPNAEITHCHSCGTFFDLAESKHHCRACGEGFCDNCTKEEKCVPERGWHSPVRVCGDCFNKGIVNTSVHVQEVNVVDLDCLKEELEDIRIRKYGEAVIGTVASVLDYPKGLIKETARPLYWVPDKDCINCAVCNTVFSAQNPIHHCRRCGFGICDNCSNTRETVPEKRWNSPVRVCDKCKS